MIYKILLIILSIIILRYVYKLFRIQKNITKQESQLKLRSSIISKPSFDFYKAKENE